MNAQADLHLAGAEGEGGAAGGGDDAGRYGDAERCYGSGGTLCGSFDLSEWPALLG